MVRFTYTGQRTVDGSNKPVLFVRHEIRVKIEDEGVVGFVHAIRPDATWPWLIEIERWAGMPKEMSIRYGEGLYYWATEGECEIISNLSCPMEVTHGD